MGFVLEVSGAVRSGVRGRDQHRCVRCGMRGDNLHHRRLKNVRDDHTHCHCNLVVMCGSGVTGCHGWAHHERLLSMQAGIVVSRYRMPYLEPIVTAQHGLVLLDCDGHTQPVEEQQS